jgi:selenocysteine lyase/cysteine desulfurase
MTIATVPLALIGSDHPVPLVTGGERRYVNLDYAASAPCLAQVKEAVDELLPWYSSVHRGAGYKSQLATAAYEGARDAVRSFLGARESDAVVFTRNTTDAVNMLAAALPAGTQVLVFASEHHANLLPWRRGDVTCLPVPSSPAEALELLERALAGRAAGPAPLVSVTGASNVTGEIWPYPDIARLAHRYGARLLLDAAQLAPHRRIDMAASGVDYLTLSGHKLYAPFGAGALVGRPDWLAAAPPFLAGGGAVRYVSADDVIWAGLPDRQEAGSPNVVGAVALGVACRTLQAGDMELIASEEAELADRGRAALAAVPGVQLYQLWAAEHPRIGVLPFTLASLPYARLAAVLSAEYGIGVRHGCFCAHPLMITLLGIDAQRDAGLREGLRRGELTVLPGAVRASMGLGTTAEDLTELVDAVTEIAATGPGWTYRSSLDGTDCWPDPDPRPCPDLPFDLAFPDFVSRTGQVRSG